MNAQDKYEHWLHIAQYDLETANTMLSGGRWIYVVFMCQQAVEKLAKGLYILYVDDNTPRIHSIRTIIERFEDKLTVAIPEDTYRFFDTLSAYYLNNRYPDFSGSPNISIDESKATELLKKTREAFAWLLTLKK